MKDYSVKASLVLIMLGGTVSGLLLYDRVLSFVGTFFGVGYFWASVPILFVISLVIARLMIKTLVKDLVTTNIVAEVSLIKALKFYISGFVGCYIAFSIIGSIVLGFYLLFGNILL